MRISDWSSDVCSSDLAGRAQRLVAAEQLHDLVDDDGDGQADQGDRQELVAAGEGQQFFEIHGGRARAGRRPGIVAQPAGRTPVALVRSEEHTSELQSLMRSSYAVFCLKKKKTQSR